MEMEANMKKDRGEEKVIVDNRLKRHQSKGYWPRILQ